MRPTTDSVHKQEITHASIQMAPQPFPVSTQHYARPIILLSVYWNKPPRGQTTNSEQTHCVSSSTEIFSKRRKIYSLWRKTRVEWLHWTTTVAYILLPLLLHLWVVTMECSVIYHLQCQWISLTRYFLICAIMSAKEATPTSVLWRNWSRTPPWYQKWKYEN